MNKLKKYIDKKISIYLLNFNIILILFIFIILQLINIQTSTDIKNSYFIFINIEIINEFVKIMSAILIFFNLLIFLKSNLNKKLYSFEIKNIENFKILFSFLILSSFIFLNKISYDLIHTIKNIENILFLKYFLYGSRIFFHFLIISSLIILYYYFIKNIVIQVKMKYKEYNDYSKYFDNSFNLYKKTTQSNTAIKGLIYKDTVFDMIKNKAYVSGHTFKLKNLLYYLDLNLKKVNELNEEDYKIIKLMDY